MSNLSRVITFATGKGGTGKTSCMTELGHILGLNSLPARRRMTVTVRLVLANPDLVKHYKQEFKGKEALADPRVTFDWLSMDDFKQKLRADPASYGKDNVLLIDEGDTVLL